MHSRALIAAALAGQAVPRVPTGPLAVHFCARFADISLRKYSTDAGALAQSVIRYYERFRPDAVWLSADTWVSAQAMGASVDAESDDQPLGGTGQPLVQTAADIDRIAPPDVGSQGRYPLMLDALQRIKHAIGRDAWIVACMDQYPFSLASALMGPSAAMLKLVDDPPFVQALMERCAQYTVAYGQALAGAGADMLSGGDSPAGLIGPGAYEQFALPFEQRVIASLKTHTTKPISLHICGNATPILHLMSQSGADIFELDHKVDLIAAMRIIGPEKALWGNLDPVAVLAQGSPDDVRHSVVRAIAAAGRCNHRRFVLSSGCTLAVETPPQNLDALIQSTQSA